MSITTMNDSQLIYNTLIKKTKKIKNLILGFGISITIYTFITPILTYGSVLYATYHGIDLIKQLIKYIPQNKYESFIRRVKILYNGT